MGGADGGAWRVGAVLALDRQKPSGVLIRFLEYIGEALIFGQVITQIARNDAGPATGAFGGVNDESVTSGTRLRRARLAGTPLQKAGPN
jgi:hypothetical protein